MHEGLVLSHDHDGEQAPCNTLLSVMPASPVEWLTFPGVFWPFPSAYVSVPVETSTLCRNQSLIYDLLPLEHQLLTVCLNILSTNILYLVLGTQSAAYGDNESA